MYGRHIGELNIIIKTSQLERRVWHQGRKDHGDKWNFAQTIIQDDRPYKASTDIELKHGLMHYYLSSLKKNKGSLLSETCAVHAKTKDYSLKGGAIKNEL